MLVGVEATFVEEDPPRDGWLALWRPDGDLPHATDDLELVLPAGTRVRRRAVAVRKLPLDEALDPLMGRGRDEGLSPSVRAWSRAAAVATELVGRGRILPDRTPSG
ncbi:MAG: hypothetical protein ACLFWM_09435 [Actinomycetota bacterium]